MNLAETILISIGLSLDVCALMMCKGAAFSELSRRTLVRTCLIFGICQTLALLAGNLVGTIPFIETNSGHFLLVQNTLSVLIFVSLGIYMFWKAWKNTPVVEHRKDRLGTGEIIVWAWATSQDAFFAGMGFGFLRTSFLWQAAVVGGVTVLAVITGLRAGYLLGYEQKSKSYLIGGLLLCVSGAEVAVHYL